MLPISPLPHPSLINYPAVINMSTTNSVQVFGRKKTATAVAYCKQGRGLIKVNGCPIEVSTSTTDQHTHNITKLSDETRRHVTCSLNVYKRS